MMQLSQPGTFSSFPSAFAAFASQLQSPHFQSLLQSQVAAIQSHHLAAMQAVAANNVEQKTRVTSDYVAPRKRVGGSTMKTAKVWRFFDELPSPEQAAECRLCKKKIKATNSSTTGMIRHLRSCHVQEYQQVQEARQSTMLLKMEEKARAQLLREMNTQVTTNMTTLMSKKTSPEPQKSPSASSSASDTASSIASSLFGSTPALQLPPLPSLAALNAGLPAPKPLKIITQSPSVKQESTEVEDDCEEPTDLSVKPSAFASLSYKRRPESSKDEKQEKKKAKLVEVQSIDERKINAQIAMMLLIDQLPLSVVEGHGFRSLLSLLLPNYDVPSAALFESNICPEVTTQLQQHLGALFTLNNPIFNPFESIAQLLNKQQHESVLTSQEKILDSNHKASDCLSSKRDEDSDSSYSTDTETTLPARIESFLSLIGGFKFPQDELISLLTLCRSVFDYFDDRPLLITDLSLTLPCIDPSFPNLARDIRFVIENSDRINSYIRTTPDMEFLPILDSQKQILVELNKHIRSLK